LTEDAAAIVDDRADTAYVFSLFIVVPRRVTKARKQERTPPCSTS